MTCTSLCKSTPQKGGFILNVLLLFYFIIIIISDKKLNKTMHTYLVHCLFVGL